MDWTLIGNWLLQGLILAGFAILGVYAGLKLFGRGAAAPGQTQTPPASLAAAPAYLAAAAPPSPRPPGEEDEDLPDVRHAAEFNDNRLTIILEGPVSLLEDDKALASTWINAVGWARLEHAAHRAQAASASLAGSGSPGVDIAEPDALQAQLDQVLYRLHLSAERRRHLRSLLDAGFSSAPAEAEEER